MKYIHLDVILIVGLLLSSTHGQVISFPVVGEYDGSVTGNVVDRSASFYPGNSSGSGNDPSLVLEIEAFREKIRVAFSNGCGGVVGFDNATITGGTRTDRFAAVFGEAKSLIVKSVDHIRTDFIADSICVPISGPGTGTNGGFLSKSVVGEDRIQIRSSFNFSFEEQGFSENEHVCSVAGTILGRNGAAETSTWLMKVTLDNGDVIAQISHINFKTGNTRDDTFFGVNAPSGRYITGVMWLNLDGNHSGLDGFAFITNGPPPAPPEAKPEAPSNHWSTDPGNPTFFGIPVRGRRSSENDGDNSSGYSVFGRDRP